jgi:alkylation response protein AidB-like acyl-CoA dehydrogenase
VGGAKDIVATSIAYAQERKAFGHAIADFGAIRHKLAEAAVRLYAAESLIYRTSGMIDARLKDFSWDSPDAPNTILGAVEEYAVECSIAKVYCSEMLDFVADEGVQIHGGYGFHQDYMVERAYRDARINRIFEGTNEINRLLTTGMLLKRGAQGRLALNAAVKKLTAELAAGEFGPEPGDGPLEAERALVDRAKKVAVMGAGIAYQRFGAALETEQEVTTALADIIIAIFAMESALLRAEKLGAASKGETAVAMTRVLVSDGMGEILRQGTTLLAASAEGEQLSQYHGILRKLTRVQPVNTVALRRQIAARLLETGRYPL